MVGKCSTLTECEAVLEQRFDKKTGFAGLCLKPEDLSCLARLIRRELSIHNPSAALRRMVATAPLTLVCFMAGMGKTRYTEGRYWPEILNSLGLSGQRWERLFGEAFLECLHVLEIPALQLSGPHRYVGEILFQGGIPDSCLGSFYRHVVGYFYREGLLRPEEIKIELEYLRHEEAEARRSQERADHLARELSELTELLRDLKELDRTRNELSQIEERLSKCAVESPYLLYPGDQFLLSWEDTGQRLHSGIQALAPEIDALLARRKLAEQRVARFTPEDERLIACSHLAHQLGELWQGEALAHREYDLLLEDLRRSKQRAMSCLARFPEFGHLWEGDKGEVHSLQDVSLVPALETSVQDRLSAEDELREKDYLRTETEGCSVRIKPFTWTQWLGPGGLLVSSITLTAVAHAVGETSGAVVLPLMLAAIIAFIGAFLRALAVSRAAVHHRQVSERWHAAVAQLADSLGRMGIPESLAATVGPDEIAALKFFFDERAVQADLSQKINLARARLDENRRRIDELNGEVFHAAYESAAAQARLEGISFGQTVSPGYSSVCPVRLIRTALARKKSADAAASEIKEDIDPRLGDLLKQSLMRRVLVALATAKLSALGQGNVEAGLRVLKQIRKDQDDRNQLKRRIFRLVLKREKDASADRQELENRTEQLKEQLRSAQVEAKRYSPAFPYADEPVSRYVVLGGDAALGLVCESVELYSRYRRLSRFHTQQRNSTALQAFVPTEEPSLTPAMRAFSLWLSSRGSGDEAEVEPDYETMAHSTGPYVVLRTDSREIVLVVPHQKVPLKAVRSQPSWVVISGDEKVQRAAHALALDDESCVVRGIAVPLPVGQREVHVALSVGDVELAGWRLDVLWLAQFPSLFNYRTGRKIAQQAKPELLWIVLPPDWCVKSNVRLIQRDWLANAQDKHSLLLVDLEVDPPNDLTFECSSGQVFSVPVDLDADKEPSLIGDHATFTLEGQLVYLDSFPDVFLPLPEEEMVGWTVHVWELASIGSEERRTLYSGQLSDLRGWCLREEPRGVTIALQLIAELQGIVVEGRIGQYTVRLAGPRRSRWLQGFFVMPSAEVWFDPAMRVPSSEASGSQLTASMILPDGIDFICDDESKVSHREEGYVEVLLGEDESVFRGWLHDGTRRYLVEHRVPRVFVRVDRDNTDAGWSSKCLTGWIDDLESARLSLLLCDAGPLAIERVVLELEDARQFVYKDLFIAQQRTDPGAGDYENFWESEWSYVTKVDFELGEFMDSLRLVGPRATFYLTLYSSQDRKRKPVVSRASVLQVDTEWLIENLRCDVAVFRGGQCYLTLSWQEVRKAAERSLLMWSRSEPWQPAIQLPIPEDIDRLTVDMRAMGLKPGPYRVQFIVHNPWGTDEFQTCSGSRPKNVFDIDLAPAEWPVSWFARGGYFGLTEALAEPVRGDGGLSSELGTVLAHFLVSLQGFPPAIVNLGPIDLASANRGAVPDRGAVVCTMLLCPSRGLGTVVVNSLSPSVLICVTEKNKDIVLRAANVVGCSLLVDVGQPVVRYEEVKKKRHSEVRERTTRRIIVQRDRVAEVLSSLRSKTEVLLPWEGNTVSLTMSSDGLGLLRMKSGTKCLVCGRVFSNQMAFHAYEHKRVCPADRFIPSYTHMDATLYFEWKPFAAVKELCRVRLPHVDLTSLFLVGFWLSETRASSYWQELFAHGNEISLMLALLNRECEILEGLHQMMS